VADVRDSRPYQHTEDRGRTCGKRGLHQGYTEKEVRESSMKELCALNATSTDEELQIWQFFLNIGFWKDEVAHDRYTDIDFKAKTIGVREKRQFNWELLRIRLSAPHRMFPTPKNLRERREYHAHNDMEQTITELSND
jgi:hypothetical protein